MPWASLPRSGAFSTKDYAATKGLYNMQLKSSKEIEKNKYELEIAVGGEEFSEAVTRAFRKNAPKIQVPGFRKGKAPRKMIEKMYGEQVFWEDAVNELYPSAYEVAVKEAGIEPVDRAEIEVTTLDANGFTFLAKVFVKPDVTVKAYKGLKAEKETPTVSDEEIEAELKRHQERGARIINIDDRAAAQGDSTVIDFEGFVDGVPFEGGKGEGYTLVLGSGQFIPGFEEQIVGHSIGEEFDVTVTFPEEYHSEELKGKPALFKVKLNEISSTELPALDDEFAKDVSEFDTLAEFKEDIKKNILEHKEHYATENVENALIDQIIDAMEGDIPEVMYQKRVDEMVQDFEYRLKSQGLDLDTYLRYTNGTMESFRKTFEEQAARQVKIRLALEKIASLESLTASQEELDAEYKKIADAYKLEAEQVKGFVAAEELSKDIIVNKAIDLVRSSAEISEKSTEEQPKKAAKPKKAAVKKTTDDAEVAAEEAPAPKKPATRKKASPKTKTEE